MTTIRDPEVLAPVASWDMLQAAIHNGADAVYLGMPHFNARGRSPDFSTEELKYLIDTAHLYGVRVFLACNVLVFEKELSEIEEILREVLPLGPDALIVQDLGLVRLIKKLAPHQVVHASTQMTVTNSEAIALTSDLDIRRYVLGREVSIKEMGKIREETEKELEVFVHGALCVAYSGQCLTSESHGGRSANRGQCAQSCRLSYALIVDGKERELGDKRHLVSPQDLCGLDDIDRLVEVGIDSFKIEGRYKSPEYVASTVRNYHDAKISALSGKPLSKSEERAHELGLTFRRGHFNGWFDGANHQKLVDARYSRPQGHFIGEVKSVDREYVDITTQHSLEPGDGVVFQDFEREIEVGSLVFSARPGAVGTLRLRLDEHCDTRRIHSGMAVFHNSSSSLDRELRQTYKDKNHHKKISVNGTLVGKVDAPLTFSLTDSEGHSVSVVSEASLAPARSAPLSKESAENELGALSGSPFHLSNFSFQVSGAGFIHTKELKSLRRAAVEKLTAERTTSRALPLATNDELTEWKSSCYPHSASTSETPHLNVLIRNESQLEALVGQAIHTVYLDYEFNKEYERSLAEIRKMGFRCGIATTRILKPGELGHLKYIERLNPDLVLVRNLGALSYFQGKNIPLRGDFSLNVTNGLTAHYLVEKGLQKITASYDLSQRQLLDLVGAFPGNFFEVTVHQYMPAFHMEHCVFAAFLSNGSSYRDCGRPCEKHRVELRDPDGTLHPLKADAECRNTMFQGKPQSATRLVPELIAAGVRTLRVEALYETVPELRAKIEAYAEVISGREEPEKVFARLGIVERYGVTEGQLFNNREYLDKKKYHGLSVLPS